MANEMSQSDEAIAKTIRILRVLCEESGIGIPTISLEAAQLLIESCGRFSPRLFTQVIAWAFLRSKGVSIEAVHIADTTDLLGDSECRHSLEALRGLPMARRRSEETLRRAMQLTRWNGTSAAQALGIPLRTFRRDLARFNLTKTE